MADEQNRTAKQGPPRKDTDGTLLALIADQPGGFGTAADIAPDLHIGPRQTGKRLDQLVEDGLLHRRRIGGGGTKAYWLSDDGDAALED